MSQNRDIRNFFTKQPKQQSSSQAGPSSSPPDDLPSSPRTPTKAPRAPLSRDDEIKGSDDEDSDESIESLSVIFGIKPLSTSQNASNASPTTPKAKRQASGMHKSPLTLQQQPQKHKYDLKALLQHKKQDNAWDESNRRAEELLKSDSDSKKDSDFEQDFDKMKETARALLFKGDEGDSKGEKFVQAISRTQGDEQRKRCYFFDPDSPPPKVPSEAFPKTSATGIWQMLRDDSRRSQLFIRGLPVTVMKKAKTAPDDIFLWVLSEVCREKNLQLRIQYINFLAFGTKQIHRLVTTQRLYDMLGLLGGPEWSPTITSEFKQSSGLEDPYSGRNWSFLENFLKLLTRMAKSMAQDNVVGAIQMLLRMSLDPIVGNNISIRKEHSDAMNALLDVLPASDTDWNSSCQSICSYMDKGTQEPVQRVIAIKILSKASPRASNLRRRLASMTLFRDPSLASRDPNDSVTLDDIFDRIAEPDFQVKHTTDFIQLQALVALLDNVIGHGQHLRPRTAGSEDETKANDQFNADIDKITRHLKFMHDKINANSLISRKEAKADIDCLGKRLTYTVRTRPPPKISLYEEPEENDLSLPKQRDFMQKWAKKKGEESNGKGPVGSDS